MRILLFVIQKEFIQIFKNKAILPLITILPIIQVIVLSFAASNEVKDVRVAALDQDGSQYSRRLINKVSTSERFIMLPMPQSQEQADALLQNGEADVIIVFPPNFERDLIREKHAGIQLLIDAINGTQAAVGATYLGTIIQDYNREIRAEVAPALMSTVGAANLPSTLTISSQLWYNPLLNFKFFMVPGILGEIVTIIIMMLTAMNVVRERELGTIEQINVTPIKKWQFILGKLIPFLIIGMMLISVGMLAGKIIFDVPFRGSILLVFAYAFINVTVALGLGLFISNLVDTQQQAIFITFFFVIIFVLMCGLFTPIESMPIWAQKLTIPNPMAHFVAVMRGILLKGSGFAELQYHFVVTAILSVVFNTLAVLSYRKVA